ncbi:MAG: hypothetical protein JW966_10520 [Anaerolineae bacterium]|nr:hypothetical protein [Anaerolineae bacterium]
MSDRRDKTVTHSPLPPLQPLTPIECPRCGESNPSWRAKCQRCDLWLPRPDDSPPPIPDRIKRPGYITGWALFFGFYILLSASLFASDSAAAATFSPVDLLLLIGTGVLTLAAVLVIAGVWRLEPWARVPAIVIHVVLIALVVANMVTSPLPDTPGTASGDGTLSSDAFAQQADVCGNVFWILLNGAFIAWFATHKDTFRSRR